METAHKSPPLEYAAERTSGSDVRDNVFGKLCKIGIAIWTVLVGLGSCVAIVRGVAATGAPLYEGEQAMLGMAICITIGIWLATWLLPASGLALLYVVFGRRAAE